MAFEIRTHHHRSKLLVAVLSIGISALIIASSFVSSNFGHDSSSDRSCVGIESQYSSAFSPPYSDSGVDTDGNGLYDHLEVCTVVNITENGTYDLGGVLYDNLDDPLGSIDTANSSSYLELGVRTFNLSFDGMSIRARGVDGPFLVALYLLVGSVEIDRDSYNTSAYNASQFEIPLADLQPPYTDSAIDTDLDGYYDYLVVDSSINVSLPEVYSVEGTLLDGPTRHYITSMTNTTFLAAGTHAMELQMEGIDIFSSGFDGPYLVRLRLLNANGSALDSVEYVTASYAASDFGAVARLPSETFRMYDFFQQPWGEWWPWRFKGYGTDIILTNETGKYTMIYNPDKNGFQGIIYAPYRWNITAENMSQVTVHNPEFMPVLGTPGVEGAEATVDVYFQYLDWDWWNSYWKPVWNMSDSVMTAQTGDGYYPGVTYSVTMNRQAAEEWLGMPQSDNPLDWWAANGGSYISNWSDWILNEGNVRLDIWAGYEWPYVDMGTKMKLQVQPDGRILLEIGHLGEGYEILMTRWLNETSLCNHEAYYEDMSVHAVYYSDWMDFNFDAVCQYSLHAVKANESATNEPAWAWEPQLIDYVASWNTPGGLHPSKYDPWDGETYQSWNAGDPSFRTEVPYDSGVSYFNLTSYQTFIIELPKGNDNIGFYAQDMPFNAIRLIKNSARTPPYDRYPEGSGSNYNYGAYWPIMMNGTMSLGWYGNWTGPPDLDSCYDSVTKTITMVGPMVFDNTHHTNGALYHGAPWIEFNVTNIVDNTPPIAVASVYPNPANATDLVTLDGSLSSDPGGTIVDYNWTFTYDGVPREFHGQVVQFVFITPGTYEITLNCTDAGGNYNSTTVELVVGPVIPEFGSLTVVIVGFVAIFLLVRRSRRKPD